MSLPDRATVVHALIAHLSEQLAGVEAMARLASDEVTSEETRSEGKYDTRSIEASYLARGQAERVGSLRAALSAARGLSLDAPDPDAPVGVGSLVEVEPEDGEALCLLVVALGGGTRLTVDDATVRVITPDSPLGRAILGAEVDDAIEVDMGGRERIFDVTAVG